MEHLRVGKRICLPKQRHIGLHGATACICTRNDSGVRILIDQQLQFDASGTSVVAGVVTSISTVVA